MKKNKLPYKVQKEIITKNTNPCYTTMASFLPLKFSIVPGAVLSGKCPFASFNSTKLLYTNHIQIILLYMRCT